MKIYQSPEVEILLFHTEDVMEASQPGVVTGGSETPPIFYKVGGIF